MYILAGMVWYGMADMVWCIIKIYKGTKTTFFQAKYSYGQNE